MTMRAPKKPKVPLTEAEWSRVFRIRCASKQGQRVTEEEHALINRAYAENSKRYGGMDADVFDATVPAGSAAKAKR